MTYTIYFTINFILNVPSIGFLPCTVSNNMYIYIYIYIKNEK